MALAAVSSSLKETTIHPTAIVSPKAILGEGVNIGPYCIIGDRVRLGDGVKLHSHVVIDQIICSIGSGTEIYPFACLNRPQDLKFQDEPSEVLIGSNNIIREYVTIQPGTAGGLMQTVIGNDNLLMASTHVAHDCHVGNNVIMANHATLAGHVNVGNYVLLGGLSAVHQFVTIGDYAVIGGMAGVNHDVLPYGNVRGDRAFLNGLNIVGMRRRGFTNQQIDAVRQVYDELFDEEQGTLKERIAQIVEKHQGDEAIARVVEFVQRENLRSLMAPRSL